MSSRSDSVERRPARAPRRRVTAATVLALGMALALPGCRTPAAIAPVTLQINAPEADLDAEVFVDGQYIGALRSIGRDGLPPLTLAPGVHRVEVRKAGRFPVQKTVEVDRDTPAQVVIEAELLEDPG